MKVQFFFFKHGKLRPVSLAPGLPSVLAHTRPRLQGGTGITLPWAGRRELPVKLRRNQFPGNIRPYVQAGPGALEFIARPHLVVKGLSPFWCLMTLSWRTPIVGHSRRHPSRLRNSGRGVGGGGAAQCSRLITGRTLGAWGGPAPPSLWLSSVCLVWSPLVGGRGCISTTGALCTLC